MLSTQTTNATVPKSASGVEIISYSPLLAKDFKEINAEWIQDMFVLESKDLKVLNDPDGQIISTGGAILFAKIEGLGIVGAGALMKTGEHEYELTKMGVLAKARGRNAGGYLLQALIEKAKSLGALNLYLLTNRKCKSAIHLYEKHGFQHDPETMHRFGDQYQRCDVAMRFRES